VAAFLANVGANAGHTARSQIFEDGTFSLTPIPEECPWRPPMLRFADIATHALPRNWLERAAHLDPDLGGAIPTYGDNCRNAGRAFSLRRARPGDLLAFVARLHGPGGAAAFHIVGALEVEDVLADVTADPGAGWWDGNAHIRRARAHGSWNSFWVFKGASGSRLFEKPARFGREELARVFGDGLTWRNTRTQLQTIGSYTRAVRRVEGEGEAWLRSTCLS
jgi:hypothetical protein